LVRRKGKLRKISEGEGNLDNDEKEELYDTVNGL